MLVVLFLARQFWREPTESTPGQTPIAGSHEVVRIVDGDTILFAPDMRVRLIGVNAPESVKPDSPVEPWGPEASEFTREFLAGGTAQLEFDRERYDQYDRFLAYVWVGDRMLNEELLRAGLARWERNFNYSGEKKARFRAAQDEARRAGRGIWSTGVDEKKNSSLRSQSAFSGIAAGSGILTVPTRSGIRSRPSAPVHLTRREKYHGCQSQTHSRWLSFDHALPHHLRRE